MTDDQNKNQDDNSTVSSAIPKVENDEITSANLPIDPLDSGDEEDQDRFEDDLSSLDLDQLDQDDASFNDDFSDFETTEGTTDVSPSLEDSWESDDFTEDGFDNSGFDNDDFNDDFSSSKNDSFFKKHMFNMIIGVIVLVGGYLFVNLLFEDSASNSNYQSVEVSTSAQEVPSSASFNPFSVGQGNKIEQTQSLEKEPQETVSENIESEGSLLSGAVPEFRKPVTQKTIDTTQQSADVSAQWRQPPMPAPISKDIEGDDEVIEQEVVDTRPVLKGPPQQNIDVAKEISATGSLESRNVLGDDMLLEDSPGEQLDDALVEVEKEGGDDLENKNVLKEEEIPTKAVEVETKTVVASPSVAEVRALEQRLQSLDQRFSSLFQRMKQLEQIGGNRSVSSSEDKNQNLDQLEAMFNGLEDRLNAIEAKQKEIKPVSKSVVPSKTVAKKESTKKEVAVKVIKSPPSSVVKTKPEVTGTGWVLRAAQPGVAWVSDRSLSSIREVREGQSLDGVGTIQSIQVVNGRWVVLGTQGQIRQ